MLTCTPGFNPGVQRGHFLRPRCTGFAQALHRFCKALAAQVLHRFCTGFAKNRVFREGGLSHTPPQTSFNFRFRVYQRNDSTSNRNQRIYFCNIWHQRQPPGRQEILYSRGGPSRGPRGQEILYNEGDKATLRACGTTGSIRQAMVPRDVHFAAACPDSIA